MTTKPTTKSPNVFTGQTEKINVRLPHEIVALLRNDPRTMSHPIREALEAYYADQLKPKTEVSK